MFPDVLIIGGGATGLLTAIHLKEPGADEVVLLERHHLGLASRIARRDGPAHWIALPQAG